MKACCAGVSLFFYICISYSSSLLSSYLSLLSALYWLVYYSSIGSLIFLGTGSDDLS